jgi:hypothetical protein
MANPQLVQYIKDNSAKGISREVLTKTLTEAGWSASDVQDAFVANANPAALSPATPAPTSTVPAQNSSSAEFLAQMEERRKKAEAEKVFIPTTPAGKSKVPTSTIVTETGLIGLLLKTGVVKTKQQANMVLIGVLVVVLALVAWVNLR